MATLAMKDQTGAIAYFADARYITQSSLAAYLNAGWACQFLYVRGDNLHCFLATFQCCDAR
jgi:hypothetical protein